MAQISRPFQIGLVVVALLAGVWFFAFHGRSSSSSSSTTPPRATQSAPPAPAKASASTGSGTAAQGASGAGAPSAIYHGAAPGVSGLSSAIAKAHGAVAVSQQNNAQLEQKSAQATESAAPGQSTSSTPGTSAPSTSAPAPASTTTTTKTATVVHAAPTKSTTAKSVHTVVTKSATTSAATTAHAKTLAGPPAQLEVESELKRGKIVVLLFWNPAGTDDRLVQRQLRLMLAFHSSAALAKLEAKRHGSPFFGRGFDKMLAVHESFSNEVANYGSITRGVQVYGTPTMLIVNPKGPTTTITGITDAYGIEQAIAEAHAS
jgi:hypothetical protein